MNDWRFAYGSRCLVPKSFLSNALHKTKVGRLDKTDRFSFQVPCNRALLSVTF